MTTIPNEAYAVPCPKCKRTIGAYQQVNGKVWLNIGGLAVRDAYGICTCCGAEFSFHSSDKQLEELLARTKAKPIVS